MNETFDALQSDMQRYKKELLASVLGFYDEQTFVFVVLLGWRNNGKFHQSEEVYSSDRMHCLKRYRYFQEEAKRVAAGGRMNPHPGRKDFTKAATGFEGSLQEWLRDRKAPP